MSEIKIIVKNIGETPEVRTIDNNDLEAIQGIVGGYIETVPFVNDFLLIVNEEGLLKNLPFNFYLHHNNPIFGNAFVTVGNLQTGDFESLSQSQIDGVLEVFRMMKDMGYLNANKKSDE